ncbi:MAG: N-6 DNA methylase [Tannerella sp.]|jgi:SAM-dependent methyltransferase|nr:N-6 DNA methylase [Tannerella sp.]
MYNIIPQKIGQSCRAEINSKILHCIESSKNNLTKEAIYNTYTGIGGLHNLKQADFASYKEYSRAKKEFEMGQFFTPHEICKQMVELVSPDETDMVLDMCCGIGNFFNHLPNLYNAYGFDIDANAVKVAKHLYPDANIEMNDLCCYNPEQRFDYIIGNPPFNLEIDGTLSQFYYMNKAYWVLNPTGILLLIVPCSFLSSEFWEKSRVTTINRDFSFIGQTKLPENAFASTGVEYFATKIMVFMRESREIPLHPYKADEFVSIEELQGRIHVAKQVKQSLRLQIRRETQELGKEEIQRFEYLLKKYLYELKMHPHLQKHYKKAVALVSKYRNQTPPLECSKEEFKQWEKRKLTPAKVLSVIYRYIKKQNDVPRKEVALVRTNYGFKLKEYAPRLLTGIKKKYTSLNDLILNNTKLPLPKEWTSKLLKQYKTATKTIARKRTGFEIQSQPFSEMTADPHLHAYIRKQTFVNKEMKTCRFTKLQIHDMNCFFQKRYTLLNWQQGSGKTAVIYHYGRYHLLNKRVKNVIVTAPAIAINLTWEPFLKRNGEKFITVKKWDDFNNIPEGIFVVVSLSMLSKLKRYLMKFVKSRSQKICLLFDESDEITNPLANRTKNSLDIFRRLKYKLLATGTTTRNNINELYSQIELLYNNSVNMICWCMESYYQDQDKNIYNETNGYYGEPFPARGGSRLFKACFCPVRATVFGIEKQNQDVYNKDHLAKIIAKTIITRKFREFAGEKYEIFTHYVKPSEGEKAVYKTVLKEFYRIVHLYFSKIDDARKESQLKLIRQIQLLIKACSIPNSMEGYYGKPYPTKAREIEYLVKSIKGKVAIGCTTLDALGMYELFLNNRFPDRPIFVIKGNVSFRRREKIIEQFEATENGILVCTQQSLKSSANIPSCDDVILESLQWNIPKMEQFYFRFIRLDSENDTRVHFISYSGSIEQNLMALVLTKERLNEFIKSGEVKEESEIFDEFGISPSIIESLLTREQDDEGNFYIAWGGQQIA